MTPAARTFGTALCILLAAAHAAAAQTVTAPAATILPAPVSTPASTAEPTTVVPGGKLTLEQCVEIAVRRSPSITAAESSVNAAAARVGQARSTYYPQVGLTGSFTRASSYLDPTNGSTDLYQGNASVNQMLFDFGKTPSQVRIQRLNEDATRSDRRNTVSTVVFGVKQAYYSLLQAEKNKEVAKETVKLAGDQFDQAKGFYDAGVKSKYDVTQAEVNLSNANLGMIRAENSVQIAKVTLKNAMGAPDLPDFTIEDTLAFQKNTITFDDAVRQAYGKRPDLLALQARRDATQESVSLARTGFYPVLTGSASYGRTDDQFVPERSGWSAGVLLTVPLFNGFLTTNQVKEAKENLYAVRANEEALRQNILLDVQQAHLNLRALEDAVVVAELSVRLAQENYDIANGRYNAGVGNPLDVTNALVGLTNAKTNHIAALANYKVAEAALLKAMGE